MKRILLITVLSITANTALTMTPDQNPAHMTDQQREFYNQNPELMAVIHQAHTFQDMPESEKPAALQAMYQNLNLIANLALRSRIFCQEENGIVHSELFHETLIKMATWFAGEEKKEFIAAHKTINAVIGRINTMHQEGTYHSITPLKQSELHALKEIQQRSISSKGSLPENNTAKSHNSAFLPPSEPTDTFQPKKSQPTFSAPKKLILVFGILGFSAGILGLVYWLIHKKSSPTKNKKRPAH